MIQLLLLIAGIGLLYSYVTNKKLAEESLNWPHVEGQIHAIQQVPIGTAVKAIVYSYTVNGKQYEAKKAFFGNPMGRAYRKSLNEKFHVNDRVPVYYQPENPQTATLITGFVPGYKYELHMGLMSLLLLLLSLSGLLRP